LTVSTVQPMPVLGVGLAVKPQHWEAVLACEAPAFWVEVHTENHMVEGGPRLEALVALQRKHPLSLHGVGLSLAGQAPIDNTHLLRIKRLVDRLNPALVSEHMAWCRRAGVVLPDLLPIARTTAECARIADRIDHVQNTLGRAIALENPTHYLTDAGHKMPEDVFFNTIQRQCGNTWIVDLTNVLISAHNTFKSGEAVDPTWVFKLPSQTVSEIHLAGFSVDSEAITCANAPIWIDSHSASPNEDVLRFYEAYLAYTGPKPTLIEWDNDVPSLDVLWAQRTRFQSIFEVAKKGSQRA
jgi:uncharacterized protein (UPF0276 family)